MTLSAAALLVVVGMFGYTQLDSEFSVTDCVPRDEPLLETFDTVTTAFADGFDESTRVLITGTLDRVPAHNALIAALGDGADLEPIVAFGAPADQSSLAGILRNLDDTTRQRFGVAADGTVASDTDVGGLYTYVLETVPDARLLGR